MKRKSGINSKKNKNDRHGECVKYKDKRSYKEDIKRKQIWNRELVWHKEKKRMKISFYENDWNGEYVTSNIRRVMKEWFGMKYWE